MPLENSIARLTCAFASSRLSEILTDLANPAAGAASPGKRAEPADRAVPHMTSRPATPPRNRQEGATDHGPGLAARLGPSRLSQVNRALLQISGRPQVFLINSM